MKKIAVFTGAGVSAESGIATFRDSVTGLWFNYKVDEVATADALRKTPKKVFDFHNIIRGKLKEVEPNDAHKALVQLEDKYDVTIVTQNVDDLHERAGSKKVFHLHGELFKARNVKTQELYEWRDDLTMTDRAPDGSKLRPHTVLFEEIPYNVQESYEAIVSADILLIIGTSFDIGYTSGLIRSFGGDEIYYVDPKPAMELGNYMPIKFIKKKAVAGVTSLAKKLLKAKS